MKKVYQQYHDDCYRACIASIFELEIEEVPHFRLASKDPMLLVENGGEIPHWDDWFEERGFVEVTFIPKDKESKLLESLSLSLDKVPIIACAKGHAVVWRRGRLIFDPASNKPDYVPYEEFEPEYFFVFVPINPHKCMEDMKK